MAKHDAGAGRPRKAAVAALVGTSIEYYDYYAYATASALVFGKLFFPVNDNPFVGTMAAFATFAVGFLARPFGGIVFGHFGDRVGRKAALVSTLLIMGTATFLVGVLPTYETAGVFAPIALTVLRLVQGFAVGGEWGGAALISVEHAPPRRKTFYSSFAQLGSPGGTVLSSAAFSMAAFVGGGSLLEWAWRIPFLLSAVLIVVGLVIRLRLEESPEFRRAVSENAVERSPVRATLRSSWKVVVAGIATVAVGVGGFYMTGTLFLSYAVNQAGVAEQTILNAQLIAASSSVVSFPLMGLLADRFGKRLAMYSGLVATIVIAAPHYYMSHTQSAVLITLMLVVTQTVGAGAWVTIPALLSEAFPVTTRYTAMSLSFQFAGVLFGGIVPVVGAGLVGAAAGSPAPAIALLVGLVVVNIVGVTVLLRMMARPAGPGAPLAAERLQEGEA